MSERDVLDMEWETVLIGKNLPHVDVVLQIAEEAAELSAAAAKYVRVLRGINPSPVSCTKACEKTAEEIADVLVALNVFGAIRIDSEHMRITVDSRIFETMREKTARWAARIRESQRGGEHA